MQVKKLAELTEDELRLKMDALDTIPMIPLEDWPAERLNHIQRQWMRLSVELRRRGQ